MISFQRSLSSSKTQLNLQLTHRFRSNFYMRDQSPYSQISLQALNKWGGGMIGGSEFFSYIINSGMLE